MKKIPFLLVFLIFYCLLGFKTTSYAQNKALLYFCEDYIDGNEINVSEKFSTGWLTVMVDLRPAGRTFGVSNVQLKLIQIKDAQGNRISDKVIKTVPFDVSSDWDYVFFKDEENLSFDAPGTYKVICQKVDGTSIVSGVVIIVSE